MPGSETHGGETLEDLRVGVILDRIFIATAVLLAAAALLQTVLVGLDALVSVNLLVVALSFGLRRLVHRGAVRQVCVVLVTSLWLVVSAAVWFDGGVRSPSMAAYLLILMLAGLLLRARALWIFVGLSLAAAVGLLVAELQGLLPPPQGGASPLRAFVVHLVHLVVAGLFLALSVESLRRARERADRDHARASVLLVDLEAEKERADELLHNILPAKIAEQLKRKIHPIAERFEAATVLFADIVAFTPYAAERPAEEVVELLNDIFSRFDELAGRLGLEKIKTIGDAYMAVSGIPTPRPDHVAVAAEMALQMRAEFARLAAARGLGLGLRIGLHCGPVVAGVIGRRKFIYDLWGDTVNTASRMESAGVAGEVQVSEAVAAALAGRYRCAPRGRVAVKGKGEMATFLLAGPEGAEGN